MGAVRSVGRAQWAAYFLLGAGILAPWNALLTAIDYFALLFPVRV
jgi:equilibrative nucleoside transporter 1/2/3